MKKASAINYDICLQSGNVTSLKNEVSLDDKVIAFFDSEFRELLSFLSINEIKNGCFYIYYGVEYCVALSKPDISFSSLNNKYLIGGESYYLLYYSEGSRVNTFFFRKTSITPQDIDGYFKSVLFFESQQSSMINAMEFIFNNYDSSECSINNICDTFKISRKNLSHFFYSITGTSTIKFITRLRINLAIFYLSMGLSISEVASAIGIKDSNYFSSKFKSMTGKAPTRYQAKLTSHKRR